MGHAPYIVIIDDDPLVHRFIERATGKTSSVFRSGKAVLERASSLKPSACFVDIYLDGELTGVDVISSLRRVWPGIPIIAMTGSKESRLIEITLSSGADDFIRKPLNATEVNARLNRRMTDHAQKDRAGRLTFADLTLDTLTSNLMGKATKSSIDRKLLTIMKLLIEADQKPISHATLMAAVWGHVKVGKNALERKISQLRDLLKNLTVNVDLVSDYGVGYRLRDKNLSKGRQMAKVVVDKRFKVLIIEDNVISRTVIEALFEDLNCDVKAVETAEGAFSIALEQSFDLILLDEILPSISGYEAAPILKRLLPNATIIGIFGTVTPSTKDEAKCVGMIDVVSKPLNRVICQALLAQFAGGKSRSSESGHQLSTDTTTVKPQSVTKLDGFDDATINEISSLGFGNKAFLTEMLLTFIQEFEKIFPLRKNVSDRQQMVSWAHKLKGLCVNIGCLDLGEFFEVLELNPEVESINMHEIESIFLIKKAVIIAFIE